MPKPADRISNRCGGRRLRVAAEHAFLRAGRQSEAKVTTMRKTFLFAAAGVGLMVAPVSHDAQAFTPLGGTPVAPSDVTTVAGGCGFGWHRGPWGGCRRNYSSAWRCFWRGGRRICRW
jgi:hypothetical protein